MAADGPGRHQDGDELVLVRALLADAEGDPGAAAEVVALADEGLAWLPGPTELVLVTAACSARHHGDTKTVRAVAALLGESARRNPNVASVTGAWLLAEALTTNDYQANVCSNGVRSRSDGLAPGARPSKAAPPPAAGQTSAT